MDAKLATALEQLWKQAREQQAAELARAEWERAGEDTEAGYLRTAFMDVRG